MASPIPISTNEISQYQLESALDTFNNFKYTISKTIFDFLYIAIISGSEINDAVLTKFLETNLTNEDLGFREILLDESFISAIADKIATTRAISSSNFYNKTTITSNTDVDKLDLRKIADIITKDILLSFDNIELDISKISQPAIQSNSILPSSINIEHKTDGSIINQTLQRASTYHIPIKFANTTTNNFIKNLHAEASILLGAVAISLDTFRNLKNTSPISKLNIPLSENRTGSNNYRNILYKRYSATGNTSSFNIDINSISNKRKFSIINLSSNQRKRFLLSTKKIFKSQILLPLKIGITIGKGILKTISTLSRMIIGFTKFIFTTGKAVFKNIGKSLATVVKLAIKVTSFSTKMLFKLLKPIITVAGPYLLGFFIGYITTKFFKNKSIFSIFNFKMDTFVSSDGLLTDNNDPYLKTPGAVLREKFDNLYKQYNTPLTDEEIDNLNEKVNFFESRIDKSSPIPIPIQLIYYFIDNLAAKIGLETSFQEKAIHRTNYFGILFKGKNEYAKIIANTKHKNTKLFTGLTDIISGNRGKGKLDIIYDEIISPIFTRIDDLLTNSKEGLSKFIDNLLITRDNLLGFFNEFDKNTLDKIIKDLSVDTTDKLSNFVDAAGSFIGAKGGALAGSVGNLIASAFGPYGAAIGIILAIIGPWIGSWWGRRRASIIGETIRAIPSKMGIDTPTIHTQWEEKTKKFNPRSLSLDKIREEMITKHRKDPSYTINLADLTSFEIPASSKTVYSTAKTSASSKNPVIPSLTPSPSSATNETTSTRLTIYKNNSSNILTNLNTLAEREATQVNNQKVTYLTVDNFLKAFNTGLTEFTNGINKEIKPTSIGSTIPHLPNWIDLGRFKMLRQRYLRNIIDIYTKKPSLDDRDILNLQTSLIMLLNPLSSVYLSPNAQAAAFYKQRVPNYGERVDQLFSLIKSVPTKEPHYNALMRKLISPIYAGTRPLSQLFTNEYSSLQPEDIGASFYNGLPPLFFLIKNTHTSPLYGKDTTETISTVQNNVITGTIDKESGTAGFANFFISDKDIYEIRSSKRLYNLSKEVFKLFKNDDEILTPDEIEKINEHIDTANNVINSYETLTTRPIETDNNSEEIQVVTAFHSFNDINYPVKTSNFGDNSSNRMQEFVNEAVTNAYVLLS